MSALSDILRKQAGGRVAWWCPGCDEAHAIPVEGAGAWGWNGNADAPTFTPSVKVSGFKLTPAGEALLLKDQADGTRRGDGFTYDRVATVCHAIVTDGLIAFCGDSTHGLAGQTVIIPFWPDSFEGVAGQSDTETAR